MNIEEIKAKAREKLEGKYVVPIITLIIFMLIIGFFNGVAIMIYNEYMSLPFAMLINGLFLMGLYEVFIKIAHGKQAKISDLFNRMDLFWKCLAVTIIVLGVTFLCGLLEVLAFKSLAVFVFYQTDMPQALSVFMILVGILLCSAIATFYVALAISFSQVYYVLYDNQEMPVMEIFTRSMDLMEEHKVDYVVYTLSFLGWAVLGVFTFGILLFWLVPYKQVSDVLFYEKLVKEEKKMLEPKKERKKTVKKETKAPTKKTKKA